MRFLSAILFVLCCLPPGFSQGVTLDSLLRRHLELRFGMFMHFSMNTYSAGWGNDRVNPKLFNPTGLNCTQWAQTAKAAGMTYGVLTAKHHDGFTIWPSKQTPPNGKTQYTIAQSSTPSVDVVKSYTDAFRAEGLAPCLYFSMWDVANGVDNNWSQSKTFVFGQLTELLGGTYGKIPLLMIDGWDWKMGHKAIPYQQIRDTVKKMQPECLITDMNGLMSPWEVDVIFVEEPKGLYCPSGNTYAACQSPTISGDWFWNSNATNSASLMSLSTIVSHLTNLEPRYCNFLLNCPPNKTGVMDQAIVDRLAQIPAQWKLNASRALLPKQPPNIEYPITPASATASSGTAANAIDGLLDCGSSSQQAYCTSPNQSLWTSSSGLPQYVTMDLGATIQNIGIVGYLPPAVHTGDWNGVITGYTVSLSTNNTSFTQVASGTWPVNRNYKTVTFTSTAARYVRLTATASANSTGTAASGTIAVASEVDAGVVLPTTTVISGYEQASVASLVSGIATYRIADGRFVVPRQFAGKILGVTVFNLSGKVVRRAMISEKIFNISENHRSPEGVYFVQVQTVR